MASGRPATAAEALRLLVEGNERFAAAVAGRGAESLAVTPGDVGLEAHPGGPPAQAPFAAILGCADARVPLELILGQQANDIFVVRVAGNVLGPECLGSLDFAVEQLETVRLLVVIGHVGCGAVSAAVDAYLDPGAYLATAANLPLRSVVDPITPAIRSAALALERGHGVGAPTAPGYRDWLVSAAIGLHASLTAAAVRRLFRDRIGPRLDVAYGIFDFGSLRVGLPQAGGSWRAGLFPAPADDEALTVLGRRLAAAVSS
jgi:carbonic anhydrase